MTVAGGNVGDGGPATNASFNNPGGVAVDTAGNLFIADTYNNRIRRVGTNGIITTVVGGGGNGIGDGGGATNANLYWPMGMAVDASGNLFIADSAFNCIRKVDTRGIITTVAGNGTYAYSGDSGPATNASLSNPYGVAVDTSGNLFIADTFNNRIRKVNTNGTITTVAGTGTNSYSGDGGAATNASLYCPMGLAVDASGNLFIADTGNYRIRKVGTNGIITTRTGGIPHSPSAVVVDASGNLIITDGTYGRISRVSTNGVVTTVAGNGTNGYSGDGGAATNAALNHPQGVALDSSASLFIADSSNNRIRQVGTNGIITTMAGVGGIGAQALT